MKHQKKSSLMEKGWKDLEISHAENIIEKIRPGDLHLSKVVFWSALVVIIFANLVVSLILIPFLIVLNKLVLYSLIFVLAGTIGFLYKFLIIQIFKIQPFVKFICFVKFI